MHPSVSVPIASDVDHAVTSSKELILFGKKIAKASNRIAKFIWQTPLNQSMWLSENCGGNIYLKMESEQVTNSFKIRGASNYLTAKLTDPMECGESKTGPKKFITASSGNHGLACSYIMTKLGQQENLTVYVASSAGEEKVKRIKSLGVNVEVHGSDCVEAEIEAKRVAKEKNQPYISAYNDLEIIFGQGTIGKEIIESLPDVDAVFVPVGGGGLISGIAFYLKYFNPKIQVIGCQPLNSCIMYESIKAGKLIEKESLPTLSSGTAGGIEPDAMTFEFCRKFVDDWVLVEEEEIEYALYKMMDEDSKMVEGAAAVGIASLLKTKDRWEGKKVVLVVCGGNISVQRVSGILNKFVRSTTLNG